MKTRKPLLPGWSKPEYVVTFTIPGLAHYRTTLHQKFSAIEAARLFCQAYVNNDRKLVGIDNGFMVRANLPGKSRRLICKATFCQIKRAAPPADCALDNSVPTELP